MGESHERAGGPDMTEMSTVHTTTDDCPSWCASHAVNLGPHPHVSEEVSVATEDRPLSVRLFRADGDIEPRILVDGQVATVEQANTFAVALRRVVEDATLAPAGLGFVSNLADMAGIGVEEMARAAGIKVRRVRLQQQGGRILSVRDLDRLALAAAHLSAARPVAGHAAG